MKDSFFQRRVAEARMHSPLSDFKLEGQPIEYRVDPLTGHICRINVKRVERFMQAPRKEGRLLEKMVEESRPNCLFCPENVMEKTPLFPRDLIPQGRLHQGESILFPNLYPFGEYHAVAVFSGMHSLMPGDFTPSLIQRCLGLAVEFIRLVHRKEPKVRYGSINWNHLPPGGASIIHPHLQIPVDRTPTHGLKELLEASKAYHRERGESYWQQLVEAERETGERLIAEDASITWLASYAPRGNSEVLAVFKGASSISQLDERQLEDFSRGFSNILKGYRSLGVESFNMSLYSGPLDEDLGYYSMSLRMISRPSLQPYYTADSGFMETLQRESVIESNPEELASRLKDAL